jgi:predicted outer membrane protein
MHRRQFLAGLVTTTGALAVTRTALAQVTPAGMMPTSVYLAMAAKGGQFLEETARDAFDKTSNPRVKRFARAEVVEQVNLSRKLAPFMVMMAGPGAPPPSGVVGGVVAAPFAIAGAAVGTATGVVGGVLGAPNQPMAPGMTSDGQKAQMIAQLQGAAPGPAYDATFVNASLMGHEEAQQIHGGYAQSGEDPQLRRIARGALPLIRQHIGQLSQMQRMMGGPQS